MQITDMQMIHVSTIESFTLNHEGKNYYGWIDTNDDMDDTPTRSIRWKWDEPDISEDDILNLI